MTSLLDPAQLEERERRRLKQLEQQVGGGAADRKHETSALCFSSHSVSSSTLEGD